jgi:pilus assembly protein CpaF
LAEELRRSDPLLPTASVAAIAGRSLQRAAALGPVDPLLADPEITEIMINGPGTVWLDRHGRIESSGLSLTAGDIALVIERVLDPLGLRVDRSQPFVDARLADGSRVNVVVPPLAVDGPVVTIRRFSGVAVPLAAFGPPEVVELLTEATRARRTLLVVGGTGAGKTTLLGSLGSVIDPGERVITIEDTAELRLPGRHVVRLEARPANSEGVGEVTMRTLIRNALRMRPDRIVIGEVRGPEALDLVLALNTGHDGSLATCHAGGPLAGLRRLETLALLGGLDVPAAAIRTQLVSAIELVVQVARDGDDRRVVEVAEVGGAGEGEGEPVLRSLWSDPAFGNRLRSRSAPNRASGSNRAHQRGRWS